MVRARDACESFSNFARHTLNIAGEQVNEDALAILTVGAPQAAGWSHKVFRKFKILLLDTLAVHGEVFVAPCIELPGEFRGCLTHVVGGGEPAYERACIFHGKVEVLAELLLQTGREPRIPEPCGYRAGIEHMLNEGETAGRGVLVSCFRPE